MKLVLHIGTEKTGTTSVQAWGARNRERLASHGICYSEVLGNQVHLKLHLAVIDPAVDDDGFFWMGLESVDARVSFQKKVTEELIAEVEAARGAGCHTFFISSEFCHSRLTTREQVEVLHRLLSEVFSELQIVCAFRPQVDMAVSLASTASLNFLRVDRSFFEQATPQNHYYNYLGIYRLWADAFGANNLELVPFKKHKDMVAKIGSALSLDTSGFVAVSNQNGPVDVRTMALVNALGFEHLSGGRRGRSIKLPLGQLPVREKLEIGEEFAREIHDRFRDVNTEFCRLARSVDLEDLEPEWERYSEPDNFHLLEGNCSFVQQLRDLLELMS